jgi:transposase-like protein
MNKPLPQHEYVMASGCKCPVCGSTDIGTSGCVEMDLHYAWQEVECNDCHSGWTDEYRLIGYNNLEIGIPHG